MHAFHTFVSKLILGILFGLFFSGCSSTDLVFRSGTDLNVLISPNEAQVVQTALDIFTKDYQNVFGGNIAQSENGQLFIGTLGNNSYAEKMTDKKAIANLSAHEEGFVIQVKDGKLYVPGSDKRGTAYGILELSRLIGVSPWEWWADSHVEKKDAITLKDGFNRMECPSVARRGIFLNE